MLRVGGFFGLQNPGSKHSKFIKNSQNYSWYLITVPNMKKIQPAIVKECARMARLAD